MKKLLVLFGLILIGLYIFLSEIDTSDYKVERSLWRVNNQYRKLTKKDPKFVPDNEFERIANQYDEIVQNYPKAKLTPRIYLQIGNVYLLKKDFTRARESYLKIISKYPENQELCAEALVGTAQTYERENNWTEALNIYEKVQDEYPLTMTGLNMPLYIASYYQRNGDLTQGEKAFDTAISYYKDVSNRYPSSPMEFNAWRLLATCYFSRKNWREGVEVLGKILNNYPSQEYLNSARASLLIKFINTVSVTQLQNYDIPIGIYQEFINKHPQHPMTNILRQMIKSLGELKSKNAVTNQKPG